MAIEELLTPDLLANLSAALDRRDRGEINAIIQTLLKHDPPLGRQWHTLAIIMGQNGEHGAALDAIDKYINACGGTAAARLEKVLTLQRAGRIVEARALLARLPSTVPDAGGHAYMLGALDSITGDVDRARESLREAVRLAPADGQNWLALATLDRLSADVATGDAIVAADPRRTGTAMKNPAAYFYALGKVFADRADHAAAFAAFAHGAAIARRANAYDIAAEHDRVRQLRSGFSRAYIDRIAKSVTVDSGRPIFVTGSPRSGTTLVEQILTSHSQVAGGGELDAMRIVAQDIGGPLQTDLDHYFERGSANDLARLYSHLLEERFPGPGHIVDKRLNASRRLGIIAAILPEAPIIWMRRDPLDCAWSCFHTFFIQSAPWSRDLMDMAAHFRIEDDLLSFWQDRLGSRLLVVPYESLVEDSRVWIGRILSHCGLAEESTVFEHHKNARAVTTASVMQVRQPINRAGIGAAEPYREFMQPFIDAYYG